jgi:hypothetical protein
MNEDLLRELLDQSEPNTKRSALRALDQAFGARIAQVWSNVTLDATDSNEAATREKFRTGVLKAIKYYELAWQAMSKHFS